MKNRGIKRAAVGSMAGTLCLMGMASPAHASFGASTAPTPPSSSDQPAAGGNNVATADGGGGGSVDRSIGNCHVVSTPDYLGESCGSVKGGSKKTIKQILGKDPLPTCWNEPMSAQEKSALNLQDTPGPEGSTYWWQKCLQGINAKTLQAEKGGIKISYGWVAIPNTPKPGDQKVVILTARQKQLIESEAGETMIPAPLAAIAPSGSPVVNQQVAFFDGTKHEVSLNEGGLELQATVTKLSVQPANDNSSTSCPGAGVDVSADDSKSSEPKACWYHFTHSSADQPDHRFSGTISASWVVRYSTDGGKHWQELNHFTKQGLSSQQVNEIEALNVS